MKHLEKHHDQSTIQFMSLVTESICSLRSAQGLSQRSLAKKAGVSHMTITKVENGEYYYSIPTLLRLTKALNTTLSKLFAEIETCQQ